MNPEVRQLIASEAGFTITSAKPVAGGFTAAEKYIANGEHADGRAEKLFIKLGHVAVHAGEAIVLDTEAAMYELIAKYQTLQRHFPTLHAYIKDESYRILVLDYLDASWGGPWTEQNLELIHTALSEIHQTHLSPENMATITHKATYLRDTLAQTNSDTFVSPERQRHLYRKVWDSNSGIFTNSRGDVYWQAEPKVGQSILYHADLPPAAHTLTVADVNFGNIGFTKQQAYIVDPVYLTMGDPAADMVGLGVNILRDMSPHDPLRQQVKTLFITDQQALARSLLHWVSCTALPYTPGLEAWMDYYQSCADTGLTIWQEMYPEPPKMLQ